MSLDPSAISNPNWSAMRKSSWAIIGCFSGMAIAPILTFGYKKFGYVSPWGCAAAGVVTGWVVFHLIEWKKRREMPKDRIPEGTPPA